MNKNIIIFAVIMISMVCVAACSLAFLAKSVKEAFPDKPKCIHPLTTGTPRIHICKETGRITND